MRCRTAFASPCRILFTALFPVPLSKRNFDILKSLPSAAARSTLLLLAVLCTPSGVVLGQSAGDYFEAHVRPVLAAQCVECHCEEKDRAGLILSTRSGLLAGGDSGPAIVPGDGAGSLMVQVMRHEDPDLEMPKGAPKLSEREIAGIEKWIQDGAQWPSQATEIVFDPQASIHALTPSAQLFVDEVRPVFEQVCFSCHAEDERGGLRLDSRERLLAGGQRGAAIVPGKPEESLLIAALRHEHGEIQMPKGRPKLSKETIDAFVLWIQSGADWAESDSTATLKKREVSDEQRAFWSFQPLEDPAIPEGSSSDWGATDIDKFVARMHDRQGLRPVGRASTRVLIRRASLDLTGLPPTPEEVGNFLSDESPDAFAAVVDRLLASEHYGERWARHWMDVTRFGEDDTRGLADDGSGRERYPMAYVHRDWVVKAFNEDMAFDTFVKAQLVADQMPEEVRQELLPGLGFLGQGPWYYDIANPAVARADERHDRVDVTSRAFLGLSVGCARCHDHKYDPIGTNDYYSLAGVFNNTNYHEYPIAAPEVRENFLKEKRSIKQLKTDLKEFLEIEGTQLARVLTSQTSRYMLAAWKVTGKEKIPRERAALSARLDLQNLERWIDFLGNEPRHYPYLKEWQTMVADDEATEERAKKLGKDFQRLLIDVCVEQEKLEKRNRKIIAKGTPLEEIKSTPMPNGFENFFDRHQLELETLDRERLNLFLDVYKYDLDNEVDTFFDTSALLVFEDWDLERQLSQVASGYVIDTRKEIAERTAALSDIPVAMGVKDKDKEDLGNIALHVRGNPHQLGAEVPRTFIEVLADGSDAPYSQGSGRLELAHDIAVHPITARVLVNRIWAWHMGRGIVSTPSNFGFAGQPPTHPELLERLASGFVANGMHIKPLHREIMLSTVYQLGVNDDLENTAIDPDNQFLWHFQRRRMEAEEIRDTLLFVSGELNCKLGGPSLNLGDKNNDRRTIYGKVSRFLPDEFLRTFDFPSPSLSAERRFSTNTALQALYFMNSPFVSGRAEALVRRLAKESRAAKDPLVGRSEKSSPGDSPKTVQQDSSSTGLKKKSTKEPTLEPPKVFDDRAMIERAYLLIFNRQVDEQELALGLTLLTEQRASWLASDTKKAGGKDSPLPSVSNSGVASKDQDATDLPRRQASLKAWVQYIRALLSSVEFRFVD
jgi:mono/diheme cytochrome c family protein